MRPSHWPPSYAAAWNADDHAHRTSEHAPSSHRRFISSNHIGLANHADVIDERHALQLHMATLYGVVEATTPQAVAHLNAWNIRPAPASAIGSATVPAAPARPPVAVYNGYAGPISRKAAIYASTNNHATVMETAWPTAEMNSEDPSSTTDGTADLPATPATAQDELADFGRNDPPTALPKMDEDDACNDGDQAEETDETASAVVAMRRY